MEGIMQIDMHPSINIEEEGREEALKRRRTIIFHYRV